MSQDLRQLYENRPINLHEDETRIVTIQPGKADQDVRCALSVISLRDKVPEALSYACGYPCEMVSIEVDGVQLQVTTKLDAALRRLRLENNPRSIWIDAISIDQTSNQERNHQVARMDQVYSQAEKVTVWLGYSEVAATAFATLCTLGDDVTAHWNPEARPNMPTITDSSLQACSTLLSLPWFGRVWTVQEAVLAKELTFVCGDFELPGARLIRAVDSYFRHGNADCCSQYMTLMSRRVPAAKPVFGALFDFMRYRRSGEEIDFAKLLFDFSHRDSWMMHDKVYGMLGLAQGKYSRLLKPDYLSDVANVYIDTAFQLIHRSQSLDSLTLMTEKDSGSNHLSWVHDWNRKPGYLERFLRDNRLLALRLSSPLIDATGYQLLESQILKLPGQAISIVTEISEAAIPSDWRSPSYIADIFKAWEDMLMRNLHYFHSLDEEHESFINSLLAELIAASCLRKKDENDEVIFFRPNPSPFAEYKPKWLQWLQGGRSTENHIAEDLIQYNNAVYTATVERKLAITDGGHVALVPERVVVGDEIVALGGGRCPYLLRKALNGSPTTRHWFIGDCHTHDAAQIIEAESTDIDFRDFYLV